MASTTKIYGNGNMKSAKLCIVTSDRKEFVTANNFSPNVLQVPCEFIIIRFQRMASCLKI
jgi:hypothetical protein